MKRGKRLGIITISIMVVVMLVGLLLAGCAESTPTTTTTEGGKYGGTLVRIHGNQPAGTPIGLPWKLNTSVAPSMTPVFDTLVIQDAEGKILPRLAEDWEIASDFLSITFYLRDDVQFHDGTDFNAEVAKWNLDMHIANMTPGVSRVSSVDVLGDYTIRMNLTEWDCAILNTIATMNGLTYFYSKTAYELHGEEWATDNPVGTGPFMLQSWDPNSQSTFVRNPNYWEKDEEGNQLPYLDKIVQVYLTEPLAAVMALRNGEGQWLNLMRGSNVDQKAALEEEGYPMIHNLHGHGLYTLFPDTVNPDSPLADLTVREAIEYAIDKETICETIGYGLWTPVYQNCPDTNAAYNPDIEGRHYDVEKAQQLLEQGGYEPGELTFNLYALASDTTLAQALQAMLKDAGMNLEIQILDHSAWVAMMNGGWQDGLFLSCITSDPLWVANLVRYFGSPATAYVSMARTPVAQKYAEARASTDYDTMIELTQEVLMIAWENAMCISLFEHEPDFNLDTSVVHDPGTGTSGYWDVAHCWLSEK